MLDKLNVKVGLGIAGVGLALTAGGLLFQKFGKQ